MAPARQTATGAQLFAVSTQLAYLHLVQGRHDESLAEFQDAIRLGRSVDAASLARVYNGAGVSYMALKRYDEAIEALRTSVGLDADTYYALFNLAQALALKGEPQESARYWTEARARWQARDWIDLYNEAIIEACLGHPAVATEKMRSAIHDGKPGLLSLALQSVRFVEASPSPPPVIAELRRMLEQSAANLPAEHPQG